MTRLAAAAGVDANGGWRSRLAARYPIVGVMPLWLVAAVVVLPALGFWLGLQLHSAGGATLASASVPMTVATVDPSVLKTVGQRKLRFLDAGDKSVRVLDADSGIEVYRVVGEAGFIRGILRGMARERRRLGKGVAEPFQLSLDAGLLVLTDLATGQRVELTAFGHTNAGAFARMLVEPQPAAHVAKAAR
jgi:putative photosynthetic complex assembly protein